MSDGTKIEWTDATWNVVNGCSVVSPGCTNCYAMRLAGTRLRDHPSRSGLTKPSKTGPVWTGETRFNEKVLLDPIRWKRPRRIFVCAHGDLFHESVPDEWIDRVFAVMALAPQHTFQVLTKRPARMRAYVVGFSRGERFVSDHVCRILAPVGEHGCNTRLAKNPQQLKGAIARCGGSPLKPLVLPNVWLGTSVEDQARANERIPELLATPATMRWLSMEPLLGPVDLSSIDIDGDSTMDALKPTPWQEVIQDWESSSESWEDDFEDWFGRHPDQCQGNLHPVLDWIVLGGESGPGSREMKATWARSIRDDCARAEVPFHFKQWGHFRPTSDCNGEYMIPVGKKAAGRLLDGVQHDGYPA